MWFYKYFLELAPERVLYRSFPADLCWAQRRRAWYGAVESVRKAIRRVMDEKVIIMNHPHPFLYVANVDFSLFCWLLFTLGHRIQSAWLGSESSPYDLWEGHFLWAGGPRVVHRRADDASILRFAAVISSSWPHVTMLDRDALVEVVEGATVIREIKILNAIVFFGRSCCDSCLVCSRSENSVRWGFRACWEDGWCRPGGREACCSCYIVPCQLGKC